ncbi:hypothetical protein KOW79_003854 [Hemibagrus wyckioides]|uniref:Dickkopf N-terminal cysteine-rich domain-containing protein n=1 Tax=Hemibagrus wyckioides TaxID=337641 RepID=A0A9D3NZU0_9TELE|nr:dickkopf-related protein 4-like [Hemibagrus wyckioides]KAG7332020.1 hypothetical protein KOW79_003854 [Hemibagrus wyckioides]
MWTLAVLALCLASAVLCLDSNEIRSSREIVTDPEPTVMPPENFTVNVSVLNNVRQRQKSPECPNQQGHVCQQTSQKRRARKKRPSLDDTVGGREARRNQCVRSRDCGEGFCCIQYAGVRRCQRVLQEGEMCLLVRPKSKSRRRLSRCSCMEGLNCLPMSGGFKGQGECRVPY